MKNPTFYLRGQSNTFALHLDEFRQEYSYDFLNKGNGRFEIRHNANLLEILILSREEENSIEVQTAGSVDIYKNLCGWIKRKRYKVEFESTIDEITLPVIGITHPMIEQLANQQTDNSRDEAIRQGFEKLVNKRLPESPPAESTAPEQGGDEVGESDTPQAWDRWRNTKEVGWKGEIWSGKVFAPRFFACHSLPCRPYRELQAFNDNELPDWNCDLPYFLELKKKVDALIAIIPPAWNVSELQQLFNDITARGRQTIFEKEILWLWDGDMSSLMGKHEITEDNKITHDNISQRILEHEEYEEKQLARNEVGERIDPPELEPSAKFWTRLKWEGHRHANWNEMQRAQETRRVWLKVYEELATLHNDYIAAQQQAGGDEATQYANDTLTFTESTFIIRSTITPSDILPQAIIDDILNTSRPFGVFRFSKGGEYYIEKIEQDKWRIQPGNESSCGYIVASRLSAQHIKWLIHDENIPEHGPALAELLNRIMQVSKILGAAVSEASTPGQADEWNVTEDEARHRLKRVGVGKKRQDRILELRKKLLTTGVDRYSLSSQQEKDEYDKDRNCLVRAKLLPP